MSEVESKKVIALVLDNGTCPFDVWLESLNDSSLVRSVLARLTRLRDGNFGDHKAIGRGVFELRVHKGPGLRIYYGIVDNQIVVLIGGGDKSTQAKDILKARKLWLVYNGER